MIESISDIRGRLADLARAADGFVELRYHRKTSRSAAVDRGKLEVATARHRNGLGVRVLANGCFGFASSGSSAPDAVRAAITRAREAALAAARFRRTRIDPLPTVTLAVGHFEAADVDDCSARSFEEKVELVRRIEAAARGSSATVSSATCSYTELLEEKAIVTSDGANASFRVARPEFRVSAVAMANGERQSGMRSVGVTGGWECLFRENTADILAVECARTAVDLLRARRPEGGRRTVILAPSIVGLLVHEAIGHTVEADFVASGSVAAGRIGTRVASDLVTLCDAGTSPHQAGAAGSIPVDDEGVVAGETIIIKNGILNSYLHDRASAAACGVAPTGNARAWEYGDQPLIRMRNTFLQPGNDSLDAMIAGVADGFLLDGPRNGQADATGEFMFGVERAWRIRHGKLGELVRGVTLSGIAFDVLQTVDAVSKDFRWDLGSGYCGKGQPAKVDAGGPYVRCQALLGGDQ